MKYQFKVAISFWEQFNALPAPQQSSARAKLRIFKDDSLDPRLRTHKINSLSASFKTTVFAVVIEGDLRAAFYLKGNIVFTFAIGTHAIYKR